MLLTETNDFQLIEKVKNDQDSEALQELVNRCTGLYIKIVQDYTYVPYFERQELLDHKLLNIYNYALDYDPNRETQFSTYVGHRIKWACQKLINKYPEPQEIDSTLENLTEDNKLDILEIKDEAAFISDEAAKMVDPRFYQILQWRNETPKVTWVEIGKRLNLSHEGVRKIYNKNLPYLQTKCLND